MTNRRAWLTPDAGQEAVTIVRPLFIPLPFLPMVAGALAELTHEWNWEASGTVAPNDAAGAMTQMLFDWKDAGVGAMSLFRLTEECSFEFSNDNGETWQVVPGWAEYAADCFTGPAGPPGETGPIGPPGETGPAGPPGVVTAQLVRVDGDTLPDFTYTPETQTLTATMQEQWLRGIRVLPANMPDVDYVPPHALELQTYDMWRNDPDEWVRLATIPPFGAPFIPPPKAPPAGATSPEEALCLAVWNAEEVMKRTYEDVATKLAGAAINDPMDALELIADTIFGLIVGDEVVASNLIDVLTILAFIGQQAAFAGTPYPANDRPVVRAILEANATVGTDNKVRFDTDAIKAEFGSLYGQPGNGHYGLLNYLLHFLGPHALDQAGMTAFYTDPAAIGCAAGWSITYDFTTGTHGWVTTGTQDSQGLHSILDGNGKHKLFLELLNTGADWPSQYPTANITGLTVVWEPQTPGTPGNQIGTMLLMCNGAYYDEMDIEYAGTALEAHTLAVPEEPGPNWFQITFDPYPYATPLTVKFVTIEGTGDKPVGM